jgi:signal transduction histidine kinase
MQINKSFLFLRGLNKKILLFFILFAFVPLLIFSILGYYLNKNMLSDIAFDNLSKLNTQFAKRIQSSLINNSDISESTIYEILKISLIEDSALIKHKIIFEDKNQVLSINSLKTVESVQDILEQYEIKNQDFPKAIIQGNNSITYFSTYKKIKRYNLIVISSLDANVMYVELNAFRDKIVFANIILAIILFILALIYSRQIAGPIQTLVEAVQHIRKGELDYNIEINTNDEIKILADEFELMRLQLQESYQGLEEKIKTRTLELHEAQAQLTQQEKMASLGLMAAGIAHEIGNPLTSISSMAQVIKRRIDDEKIVEFVNNILSNIDRISLIVRELVDFSRPSSLDASIVSVNEIVNSAVGIVKYDKRSRHIHFNLELDRNLPKTFLVGDYLLQVLINILINAVDASENFNNEINVSSKLVSKNIKIQIEDKGCGIDKEKLNRIFEPFFTTKEVGKGTGLGLTVSYGIIKKFGGEIKVKSEIEKGSTFEIMLPIVEEEL